MTADPYAWDPETDLSVYVVTRKEWGREHAYPVEAKTLRDAKAAHGWTRERHVSLHVRRARESEMPGLGGYELARERSQ